MPSKSRYSTLATPHFPRHRSRQRLTNSQIVSEGERWCRRYYYCRRFTLEDTYGQQLNGPRHCEARPFQCFKMAMSADPASRDLVLFRATSRGIASDSRTSHNPLKSLDFALLSLHNLVQHSSHPIRFVREEGPVSRLPSLISLSCST